MIELTRLQKDTIGMISDPKYKRIGCPAHIVNARALNSLIEKGIVKRGDKVNWKVFIHPDHYRKYKK